MILLVRFCVRPLAPSHNYSPLFPFVNPYRYTQKHWQPHAHQVFVFLTFNAFFKPPIVPNKSNTLHHPYPHFPYNSQQNQPCDEIVARNYLGAGRAPKARAIEKLGQKENPDIVFPFETKAHAPRKKKFKKIFVLVEALVLMW